MSELADLLEAKNTEIVAEWRARVVATLAPQSLDETLLIDSLPTYIQLMADDLRSRGVARRSGETIHGTRIPAEHGVQRFHLGYEVAAMVREFALVGDVVFDFIEASGRSYAQWETRGFSTYLVDGIAEAASHYGRARDEQLRQQAAQHLAFVAHELRNPLGSVQLAFSSLVSRGDVPNSPVVARIDRGLRRVAALIDQALLEMKLKGKSDLHLEPTQAESLLQRLADECAAEVEAKDIQLVVEVDESVSFLSDHRAVGAALSNLVRNAVKFTTVGGTVRLRAKSSELRVVIEVEDECGGLPPGKVEEMFSPFVQLGQDRSGFGLGLAIAKQAVDAHGGELRVHNLAPRGCVFVLDLPKMPPASLP
jgi:signal transduction histidine kinase